MTKAFGYTRVSGKSQIDGDGPERQRLSIQHYADTNGIEIVEWFHEEAIPGKTEWDQRPAWGAMVASLNGTKTILIEKLDRLARDLMVQEHIIADLRKRQVNLISVYEPDLCIDDPSRKLLRQIMGAIAEYDRAMITAKLAGARQRVKAQNGKCEGQKVYGDKQGERAVIEVMQSQRVRGLTFQQIADGLNAVKTPSRRGFNWTVGAVHKILTRETNAAG